MKYRPEIDGLRALAILPVVFYHAGLAPFTGGFVGVDVFFVISGYLITSIILHERRAGHFSLMGFYARRIRRILPAFAVMMAASFPVALVVLGPAAMQEFAGSLAASIAFIANIYFLKVSGYFSTGAEFKPLVHNWSLSVEEQYYLLFPAGLLLTWRIGPRLQVLLFAALALASFAVAQWQVQQGDADAAFFLLQSRVWELLLGGLAAVLLLSGTSDPAHHRYAGAAALLGMALILVAVFAYDDRTPFPGLAALLPCLGALLVILFAAPSNAAGRLLGLRPVVFIGLISYSLYLWHQPLLAFTRIATGSESHWLMLAVVVACFPVAAASWRFVETPARHMAMPRLRLFGTAAAAMALLGTLGLAGWASSGFSDAYARYRLDAATRANYLRHVQQTLRGTTVDDACHFHAGRPQPGLDARFDGCFARYGKAVVVIGDSHASNIYRALLGTGRYPFLVGFAKGGCRPFAPKPACPFDAAPAFFKRHSGQVAQLVFQVSGSHLILDPAGRADSDAAFMPGLAPRFAQDDIASTVAYLSGLASGIDVVWLGPYAEARVNLADPLNFAPERLRFNPVSLQLFADLDRRLKAAAAGHPGFRYVSLVDAFRFGAGSLVIGDCLTFHDTDHLSSCGEALLAPLIERALALPAAGPVTPQI